MYKKSTSFSHNIFTLNDRIDSLRFDSLYLFHDVSYRRSVRCVQQFSNEQWFDSSPHNARQGVGLQTVDQTFTEWSCTEEMFNKCYSKTLG